MLYLRWRDETLLLTTFFRRVGREKRVEHKPPGKKIKEGRGEGE